jgi:cyclohexanone monooxygenase
MQYSYQFSEELQQEWVWSERYAPQPEILRYANHVADRFDLRREIQFDTRVHLAIFDEAENRWVLEVGDGERVTATHCIMATGCLSSANMPKVVGIDSVFQRTPNYTIPAHNGPLDPAYQEAVKADYAGLRARAKQTVPGIDFNFNMESALAVSEEDRQREFEKRWVYGGLPFIGAFPGETYHTGHWPHEGVDFSSKRVGVIGTGSSAIQSIPIIARQAAHLYAAASLPVSHKVEYVK